MFGFRAHVQAQIDRLWSALAQKVSIDTYLAFLDRYDKGCKQCGEQHQQTFKRLSALELSGRPRGGIHEWVVDSLPTPQHALQVAREAKTQSLELSKAVAADVQKLVGITDALHERNEALHKRVASLELRELSRTDARSMGVDKPREEPIFVAAHVLHEQVQRFENAISHVEARIDAVCAHLGVVLMNRSAGVDAVPEDDVRLGGFGGNASGKTWTKPPTKRARR